MGVRYLTRLHCLDIDSLLAPCWPLVGPKDSTVMMIIQKLETCALG